MMKRVLMQGYIKNTEEAVPLYLDAFGAKLGNNVKNAKGGYYHCEIIIDGYVLAISEVNETIRQTGNVMQFCLHFDNDEEQRIKKAYQVLKTGAEINYELGECDYSKLMTDFTDRFGVRWCLFI